MAGLGRGNEHVIGSWRCANPMARAAQMVIADDANLVQQEVKGARAAGRRPCSTVLAQADAGIIRACNADALKLPDNISHALCEAWCQCSSRRTTLLVGSHRLPAAREARFGSLEAARCQEHQELAEQAIAAGGEYSRLLQKVGMTLSCLVVLWPHHDAEWRDCAVLCGLGSTY
jgi:hypothetical protein